VIRALVAAILVAGGTCGFPDVPPLARNLHGEPAAPAPTPQSAEGKLVSNATSSVVVDIHGELVSMEIGPATRVSIGSSVAAPRAVLPGSDVRVVWEPGRERNLALEIEAQPGTLGWQRKGIDEAAASRPQR
jgi:hypothetical protein